MKRLLMADDLREIASGTETCPQPTIITGDNDPDITGSIRAPRKRQNRAGVLLHNSCSLSVRIYSESLKIQKQSGIAKKRKNSGNLFTDEEVFIDGLLETDLLRKKRRKSPSKKQAKNSETSSTNPNYPTAYRSHM